MSTVALPGRLYGEPVTNIDPETGEVNSGKTAVFDFTVGEYDFRKRSVNFYKCVAFGRTAETVARYWAKNRSVVVEGNLDVNEFSMPDGAKRKQVRIIAHRVLFLTDGDCQVPKKPDTDNQPKSPPASDRVPFSGDEEGKAKKDDGLPF